MSSCEGKNVYFGGVESLYFTEQESRCETTGSYVRAFDERRKVSSNSFPLAIG